MFKYTSTHVVNSLDYVLFNAKDGKVFATGADDKSLIVNKVNKFFASNILNVKKKEAELAQTESIKFTMPDLGTSGTARLYIYMRTANQADPLMANDWIYKGKPFQIEFTVGASAAASAANLKANAGKWLNFIYGEKVITVEAEGADVTVAVANGDADLRFYKVELQVFEEASSTNNYALSYYADGGFVTKAAWCASAAVNAEIPADTLLTVTYVQKGNSGFGTYMWILKNLRLPTNANTRFYNFLADEMPAVGTNYTQYIVTCCTDRPEVQGTSVVGQYNKSITTHILWINSAVASQFETGLTSLGVSKIDSYTIEDGELTVE